MCRITAERTAVGARRYWPLPPQTETKTFNQARVGKAVFLSAMFFSFLLIELEDEKLFLFLYFSAFHFFKPKLKSASRFAITVSLFSAGVFLGESTQLSQTQTKLRLLWVSFPTDCVI